MTLGLEAEPELADESEKTKKSRRKLQLRLEELDQRVTSHALEKKAVEIHRWIARHASQRVVLRTKTISLFDENKNTALMSKRVQQLALQIGKELKTKEA